MDLSRYRRPILLTLLATAAVAWAYWTTFADIVERWARDPQYSHGFLVPVFAGYLLWSRRAALAGAGLEPRWWGAGVVLAGAGLRLAGHFLYQP